MIKNYFKTKANVFILKTILLEAVEWCKWYTFLNSKLVKRVENVLSKEDKIWNIVQWNLYKCVRHDLITDFNLHLYTSKINFL